MFERGEVLWVLVLHDLSVIDSENSRAPTHLKPRKSDELPVFIPVPFTLCWFAIITKQRLAAFQDKAHVRSAGFASVFGFPSG